MFFELQDSFLSVGINSQKRISERSEETFYSKKQMLLKQQDHSLHSGLQMVRDAASKQNKQLP